MTVDALGRTPVAAERRCDQDNGPPSPLVSVPFSGRNKDVLEDAGDALGIVLRHRVNLGSMGHRYARRALRIND